MSLWLWRRPMATAPFRLLAWEPSYAVGPAQKKKKKKKKKGGSSEEGPCAERLPSQGAVRLVLEVWKAANEPHRWNQLLLPAILLRFL